MDIFSKPIPMFPVSCQSMDEFERHRGPIEAGFTQGLMRFFMQYEALEPLNVQAKQRFAERLTQQLIALVPVQLKPDVEAKWTPELDVLMNAAVNNNAQLVPSSRQVWDKFVEVVAEFVVKNRVSYARDALRTMRLGESPDVHEQPIGLLRRAAGHIGVLVKSSLYTSYSILTLFFSCLLPAHTSVLTRVQRAQYTASLERVFKENVKTWEDEAAAAQQAGHGPTHFAEKLAKKAQTLYESEMSAKALMHNRPDTTLITPEVAAGIASNPDALRLVQRAASELTRGAGTSRQGQSSGQPVVSVVPSGYGSAGRSQSSGGRGSISANRGGFSQEAQSRMQRSPSQTHAAMAAQEASYLTSNQDVRVAARPGAGRGRGTGRGSGAPAARPELPEGYEWVPHHSAPRHLECGRFHSSTAECYGVKMSAAAQPAEPVEVAHGPLHEALNAFSWGEEEFSMCNLPASEHAEANACVPFTAAQPSYAGTKVGVNVPESFKPVPPSIEGVPITPVRPAATKRMEVVSAAPSVDVSAFVELEKVAPSISAVMYQLAKGMVSALKRGMAAATMGSNDFDLSGVAVVSAGRECVHTFVNAHQSAGVAVCFVLPTGRRVLVEPKKVHPDNCSAGCLIGRHVVATAGATIYEGAPRSYSQSGGAVVVHREMVDIYVVLCAGTSHAVAVKVTAVVVDAPYDLLLGNDVSRAIMGTLHAEGYYSYELPSQPGVKYRVPVTNGVSEPGSWSSLSAACLPVSEGISAGGGAQATLAEGAGSSSGSDSVSCLSTAAAGTPASAPVKAKQSEGGAGCDPTAGACTTPAGGQPASGARASGEGRSSVSGGVSSTHPSDLSTRKKWRASLRFQRFGISCQRPPSYRHSAAREVREILAEDQGCSEPCEVKQAAPGLSCIDCVLLVLQLVTIALSVGWRVSAMAAVIAGAMCMLFGSWVVVSCVFDPTPQAATRYKVTWLRTRKHTKKGIGRFRRQELRCVKARARLQQLCDQLSERKRLGEGDDPEHWMWQSSFGVLHLGTFLPMYCALALLCWQQPWVLLAGVVLCCLWYARAVLHRLWRLICACCKWAVYWLVPVASYAWVAVSGVCMPWPLLLGCTCVCCAASYANIEFTLPEGEVQELSRPQYYVHSSGFRIGHLLDEHPALKEQFLKCLEERRGAFAWDMKSMPGYSGDHDKMRIPMSDMTDQHKMVQGRRVYADDERAFLRQTAQELVEAGMAVRWTKPTKFVSNMAIARKKDSDGNWTAMRACLDSRKINSVSDTDYYGLPRIDELFRSFGKASYFSKIDLRSGYLQLPLHEDDWSKTCFRVDNDIYAYTKVCFGLKNAPAHFMRLMDYELQNGGLTGFCRAYMDDLIVFSDTLEEHLEHVKRVLDHLAKVTLCPHPEKTVICVRKVEFLGHYISQSGITPHEAKVSAIRNLPAPKTVSDLRHCLGVMSYYRHFCPNFSVLAAPLNELLRKNVAWRWGPEQEKAFQDLKEWLCTEGLVLRPFDPSRPLLLHTDWSKLGLGAILGQVDDQGREYMVAAISRTCNKHERNYIPYHGELLAVVWACRTFRPYLAGRHFTIITDHQPLRWLTSIQDPQGQVARWAMMLNEFSFDIQHRAGLKHQNADALSRYPQSSTEDLSGAQMHHAIPAKSLACCALYRSHFASYATFVEAAGDEELVRVAHVGGAVSYSTLDMGATQNSFHTQQLLEHEVAENERQGGHESVDIWLDEHVLHYLRTGGHTVGISSAEQKRVQRRAHAYKWSANRLLRSMPDGTTREVPAPADRPKLIMDCHVRTGHFGVNRTAHMLRLQYWWQGLSPDVRRAVRQCEACDRVHAAVGSVQPMQLNSLPIRGMGYRWGVDLFGPLPTSARGHEYCMICVEHFSKWIECIPIPNKLPETVAYAFHHNILARFGAPAEVVTDGGGEFQGAFARLLEEYFIDPRHTSANHPQANGLAERGVQTVKTALRKYCDTTYRKDSWDTALPVILLGYRCSPQASTGYTPYELMYARPPVVPSEAAQQLDAPLDYDDPNAASDSILQRAAWLKQHTPMAFNNLLVAQQRDSMHYARKRSGRYMPQLRRFAPGDFVYLGRDPDTTLDVSVARVILQVVEVRDSGVALLQGRDGRTMTVHIANLAPCHLVVDPVVDHTRARPTKDFPCTVCGSAEDEAHMLLCDGCGKGYHSHCLKPPADVNAVKQQQYWICSQCGDEGLTVELIKQRETHARMIDQAAPSLVDSGTTAPKRVSTANKRRALDGRLVLRPSSGDSPVAIWGVVKYLGEAAGDKCLSVAFSDGTQKEGITMSGLKKLYTIQPPGTEWPRGVPRPVHTAPARAAAPLAAGTKANASAVDGFLQLLTTFLPGRWARHEAATMWAQIAELRPFMDHPPRSYPTPADLQLLKSRVRLLSVGTWWNPFGYVATTEQGLWYKTVVQKGEVSADQPSQQSTEGAPPHRASLPKHFVDPLNPNALTMAASVLSAGGILCQPPTPAVELFAAMAASLRLPMVIIHTSAAFKYAAPQPRSDWLGRLTAEGRLLTLYSEQNMWLVIFSEPELLQQSYIR